MSFTGLILGLQTLRKSNPAGFKTFNNDLRTSILSVKKIYKGNQLIKLTKTDIIMLLMQETNIPSGGEETSGQLFKRCFIF